MNNFVHLHQNALVFGQWAEQFYFPLLALL